MSGCAAQETCKVQLDMPRWRGAAALPFACARSARSPNPYSSWRHNFIHGKKMYSSTETKSLLIIQEMDRPTPWDVKREMIIWAIIMILKDISHKLTPNPWLWIWPAVTFSAGLKAEMLDEIDEKINISWRHTDDHLMSTKSKQSKAYPGISYNFFHISY